MEQLRLIEACALLPMLHVATGRAGTVFCTGPQADVLAREVLRWPDVGKLCLLAPPNPTVIRDRRIAIGAPLVASCDVVICSPNDDPSPYLHAIAPSGIINVSTALLTNVRGLLLGMRQLFKNTTPWRDWLPAPLYGALATPGGGRIERRRHPPPGVQRLSSQYLPCLFTFGADEVSLVLPQVARANRPPAAAKPVQGTPEFSPT